MKILIGFLFSLLALAVGFWLGISSKDGVFNDKITNVFTSVTIDQKLDLSHYSIDNLSKNETKPGILNIIERTQDKDDYSSYLFELSFNPSPSQTYIKTTTGIINVPKEVVNPPLILMVRGYVDQELFISGMGTRRSSEYFAENGFVTIAPDYLGYGGSDSESENIFETRFQTYTTTLTLLKTLEELKSNPKLLTGITDNEITKIPSYEKLFLWAHSNGGQITLTTLAITQKGIPTVLWAPVTKPFPYSVLYYTDESEDGGKLIRNELSKLEKRHNVDEYSFTNYLDRINAPIQLYQGTNDDAITFEWSQGFISKLKKSYKERELTVNVELITKHGADHNLVPLWGESVQQSLEFFQSFLN